MTDTMPRDVAEPPSFEESGPPKLTEDARRLYDRVTGPSRRTIANLPKFTFRRYLAVTSMIVVAIVALGFCANLFIVSRFQYRAAQSRLFSQLRNELAHGVGPVSDVDRKGRLLSNGKPVALLEIPKLHLRTVVVQGTTSAALTSGPGHLRNTALPGELGTSVILGRAAAFGGPFGHLHELHAGDAVTITSGSGVAHYKVIDVRRAGDPLPSPLDNGGARITLVTATGSSFLPAGVLRVDADASKGVSGGSSVVVSTVSKAELPMGTDSSTLWALAFLLQGLIVASVGAVWAWHRWGRAQAWIVFFPVLALFTYFAFNQTVRLLPNLM
jgi:LPXTG-site transpeptidase (sortase) family protein